MLDTYLHSPLLQEEEVLRGQELENAVSDADYTNKSNTTCIWAKKTTQASWIILTALQVLIFEGGGHFTFLY